MRIESKSVALPAYSMVEEIPFLEEESGDFPLEIKLDADRVYAEGGKILRNKPFQFVVRLSKSEVQRVVEFAKERKML